MFFHEFELQHIAVWCELSVSLLELTRQRLKHSVFNSLNKCNAVIEHPIEHQNDDRVHPFRWSRNPDDLIWAPPQPPCIDVFSQSWRHGLTWSSVSSRSERNSPYRATHRSVVALHADIMSFIETPIENPKPPGGSSQSVRHMSPSGGPVQTNARGRHQMVRCELWTVDLLGSVAADAAMRVGGHRDAAIAAA